MMSLSKVIKLIKDILFPIFCADCGKEGEWWCPACRRKAKTALVAKCPVCHRPSEFGAVCLVCRPVSSLDGLAAYLHYFEKQPAAILIQKFKYQYAKDIIEVWKKIVMPIRFFWLVIPTEAEESLKQTHCHPRVDGDPNSELDSRFRGNDNKVRITLDNGLKSVAIIPVPLHSRRQRERGFNQADLIAEIFREKMAAEFPAIDFQINRDLIRHRFTQQQAKLTKEERLKNINGAFSWAGKECPKTIILIDDVFTSGATMQECAKTLKSAGAETVWGVTLARAE